MTNTPKEQEDHSGVYQFTMLNLPLDPNYLKYEPGKQSCSLMYGAEYQHTNVIIPNSYDTDIPCAVCYVSTRTTLYMMPAKYTCSSNWTTEYYGYHN